MIRDFLPRCLTLNEVEAIARVERAGASVDYAAVVLVLKQNIASGRPDKPIFDVIYGPLAANHTKMIEDDRKVLFEDDDWYQ